MNDPRRLRLVSDFNIEVLARLLRHGVPSGTLDVDTAPFGQVIPALLEARTGADLLLVWTRPEGVVESFRRALEFEPFTESDALAEVDVFVEAVRHAGTSHAQVLVVNWTLPPNWRGWGPLESRPGTGVAALLSVMRRHLLERVADVPSVAVLDPDAWFRAVGRQAFSPKLWYATKVPYSQAVFAEAAADVLAALQGARGEAKRVLVVDLDETLWGGIIGETGPQGIVLGGHDHHGEAFVDFQRTLKALTRRGVQLAIASKNEESVAMDAIAGHPDMVLRPEDFAAWRINWSDKASNIRELAQELNLGLRSFVFIDDNPAERARVREVLPEVLVPEWPADPTAYVSALWSLRCFDGMVLSDEDMTRAAMYRTERRRRKAAETAGSTDEWLATLGVTVHVARLSARDLTRAAQLLNKTNQMNLATRRLTEQELGAWAAIPNHELWTFRVSDRFGEYGLTAIVGLDFGVDSGEAIITDWLLSCRVMGRCVEETMLHVAVERARRLGRRLVRATLKETERNTPTTSFWRRSGFAEMPALQFAWETDQPYACPVTVALQGMSE